MNKITRLIVMTCLCIIASCTEVEDLDVYLPEIPETPEVVSTTTTSVSFAEYSGNIVIGTKPDLSDSIFVSERNLQPYTTYYYQAVIQNLVGTQLKGEIKSFTTAMKIYFPKCDGIYATPSNSVSLTAEIESPATSAQVLEYGFCLSQLREDPTFETSDAVIVKATGLPSSIGGGTASYTISGKCTGEGLKKGKITYARAYVKTEKGVFYGDYSTLCRFFPVSGIKENRPYVDLGLPSGTLWTAVNFAGKGSLIALPTSYFSYYEENYYSDDFGEFRMPTYEDAKELYENCTYKQVNIISQNCASITSNVNGNVIYIPFGGYKNSGGYRYYEDKCGYIWLNTQTNDGFWRMMYLSDESKIGYTYYSYHGNSRNIRLVLDD